MTQTIRQRIQDYLHRNYTASVPDLSHVLGVTLPAVQYHITFLLKNGSIEQTESSIERIGLRGRPVKYYRLSQTSKPDNYMVLSRTLLSNFFSNKNEEEVHINEISKLLAAPLPEPASFFQKMKHAIQRLTDLSYQPYWEVQQDGPRIHFRNCPYAALVKEYPVLCNLDITILKNIFELPITQESHISDSSNHPPACVFFISR